MPPTEQQFFSALQCIEDYLDAQEHLAASMKDGLLNIARGKYMLGSALGQQRYPGDMQASVLLQPCPIADNNHALYEEYQLLQSPPGQQHAGQRHHSSSCTARQQQQQQQHGQQLSDGPKEADTTAAARSIPNAMLEVHSSEHASSSSSSSCSDHLAWFSALPPQPVRQAQSDFAAALQQAVAAANALQRLRQLAAELSLQEEDAASDAA